VLGRILPLLMVGKTYDEISAELNIGRSRVYEILKIYYKVCDQNELVDTYWWGLFFWARKNKPELAFNALTAIKLKKMSLNMPTQAETIVIKWLTNEQNVGTGNSLPAPMGSTAITPESCTIPNVALRTKVGEDDVGSQRSNPDDDDKST